MAVTIITIIVTMILGVVTFFAISGVVYDNSWKIMIMITVMITSYTLVNEGIRSMHID
jgi:hypothetical protein